VKQWKYNAYILNGEAVEVETSLRVQFVMYSSLFNEY
jgi:hypothetical protein